MGEACWACRGYGYRWTGGERKPCYVCGGSDGTPIRVDERPKPGELPPVFDPIRAPGGADYPRPR